MILRGFFFAFLFVSLFPSAPASAEPVDLQLVLAVDVSGSMDDEEHALQRDGYVTALAHPQVVQAIQGGYLGRIAVTYMEWAGANSQVVTIPWRVIGDQQSASAFADELAEAPIAWIRGTSISGGLDFAALLFEGNGLESERRVIDVSGDGPNNMGPPVTAVRDRLVADGIVINGLPVMLRLHAGRWGIGAELEAYYRDCVIGGRGAFVVPVTESDQFARAIRRKLVLEIAGNAPRVMQADWTAGEPNIRPAGIRPVQRSRIDCGIGEEMRRRLFEE